MFRVNAQCCGETEQFKVGEAPDLRFDLGHHVFTNVPAENTATGGKRGLGESLLSAECPESRSDDVLRRQHLPYLEVDRNDRFDSVDSDIGRFWKTSGV